MTRNNSNRFQAFFNAAAVVLMLAISSAAFAKAELTKLRLGQSADKTRVVFEIKKNHRFEVSKMHNPARIVVDFYKADNQLSFKKKKFLDARVGQVRVKNQKKRVRVVLDLRKDFEYRYFTLGKNKRGAERVVIDVTKPKAKKVAKVSKTKSVKKVVKKAPVKKVALKKTTTKKVKAPKKVAKKAAKKPNGSLLARTEQPKKDVSNHGKTRDLMNAGSPIFTKGDELVVAIDAGHGGKDPGAVGPKGTYEKDVALSIAKRLKKYIDAQPGMRAVLTREKDVFIPLHKRVRIAHKKDADIFLSLHADAFPDSSIKGGSVYILSTSGASSVMARILARSENASLQDVKLKGRDSDVAFVLSDLTRQANIRASRKLGKAVLGEMGKSVRIHKKHVQSADFAVLKSIDMPSLLIETAFISNPQEEKKLRSNKFQIKMAKSIVRGLQKFVKRNATQPRWGEKLYVHYRVQKGDTLSEIAANYNISTYELKKLNRIKKANHLYVGKKLRIPVAENIIASL